MRSQTVIAGLFDGFDQSATTPAGQEKIKEDERMHAMLRSVVQGVLRALIALVVLLGLTTLLAACGGGGGGGGSVGIPPGGGGGGGGNGGGGGGSNGDYAIDKNSGAAISLPDGSTFTIQAGTLQQDGRVRVEGVVSNGFRPANTSLVAIGDTVRLVTNLVFNPGATWQYSGPVKTRAIKVRGETRAITANQLSIGKSNGAAAYYLGIDQELRGERELLNPAGAESLFALRVNDPSADPSGELIEGVDTIIDLTQYASTGVRNTTALLPRDPTKWGSNFQPQARLVVISHGWNENAASVEALRAAIEAIGGVTDVAVFLHDYVATPQALSQAWQSELVRLGFPSADPKGAEIIWIAYGSSGFTAFEAADAMAEQYVFANVIGVSVPTTGTDATVAVMNTAAAERPNGGVGWTPSDSNLALFTENSAVVINLRDRIQAKGLRHATTLIAGTAFAGDENPRRPLDVVGSQALGNSPRHDGVTRRPSAHAEGLIDDAATRRVELVTKDYNNLTDSETTTEIVRAYTNPYTPDDTNRSLAATQSPSWEGFVSRGWAVYVDNLGRIVRHDLVSDAVVVASDAVTPPCSSPSIGYSGEYVGFIAAGANTQPQFFVRRIRDGANTTTLVSKDSGNVEGDGSVTLGVVVSNNTAAIMATDSTNLVGTSVRQIFWQSLSGTNSRVISSNAGAPATAPCSDPSADLNGVKIGYSSAANGVVNGIDPAGTEQIFVASFDPGNVEVTGTILASKKQDGTMANGVCGKPSVSPEGGFIAFETLANNLGAVGATTTVVLKDLATGAVHLVGVDGTGTRLAGACLAPKVSENGLFVEFRNGSTIYSWSKATGHSTVVATNATGAALSRDAFTILVGGTAGTFLAPNRAIAGNSLRDAKDTRNVTRKYTRGIRTAE